MVEMLGVLAIVGVLSAGAFAGFNKAMEKYRLNTWSEGLTLMVWNLYDLKKGDNNLSDISFDNFVPQHFIKSRKNGFAYDIYNNKWGRNSYGLHVRLGGDSGMQSQKSVQYICPHFLGLIQELGIVWLGADWADQNEDHTLNASGGFSLFTDLSSKLNISEMEEICEDFSRHNDSVFYLNFR
ncbi:MAG: hypothetical protein IJ870_06875 [Alphaproteobacteria bacterium]|nr:hypothetical protein [Alphaproteobacteria bacterium]